MEEKKNKANSIAGAKIKPVVAKDVEIGVEIEDDLTRNILSAAISGVLDISKLEGFSSVAQTRESIYKVLDSMGNDSMIASILETYAEDALETNDQGRIMWCESSDPDVSKYVTYLLDIMNVDKHLFGWTYSLIKYGDLYLRLYKESDLNDDELFETDSKQKILTEAIDDEHESLLNVIKEENKEDLKEDVNVIVTKDNDHYVHYMEAVSNPGEMFELTRFGKTRGYVRAPVTIHNVKQGALSQYVPIQYRLKRGDVDIYGATDFVHASLEDTSARQPEEVSIFLDNDMSKEPLKYTVRRGQSLLYNTFKIWRELSLLENSVLLNRVTKSSIVRMISVEVGDMPKENVGNHLASIKALIEQKTALNTGEGMNEYNNPGPIENNIYIPTHGGIGAISTQQIGGDVDPKKLTDLEYYQDKFFGSFRVPKQFFGVTDDAAGFNGGSSLSIISSRYGKAVKRVQNTMVQVITDAINLMLLDKGLTDYINKFSLRMTAPVTQEEIDKRENTTNKIRIVSDVMNVLNEVSPTTKLKILKVLLSNSLSDTEIVELLQEEIDTLEKEEIAETESSNKDTTENSEDSLEVSNDTSFENTVFGADTDASDTEVSDTSASETSEEGEEEGYLPSASELGLDLTQND